LVSKRCNKGKKKIKQLNESKMTNNPYISVVFPTMRIGGLDVVFNSLENQTFKNFEVIIADNIYEYRKDIVKEKAKKYSFRYKHISPIINKFPMHAFCHTLNSAIVQASGEVILFVTDYKYFMPWTLQKHADFHMSHSENIGYAPSSKFLLPPPMKLGLPSYGRSENYNQYIADLKDGKLTDHMWSIFDNDIFATPQDLSMWPQIDRVKIGYDPKESILPGLEVSPLHIYLQSESVKTKIVLAANGINEELDGAPNYQDIEFSHRIRNLFNFKWIGDNANATYRITGGEKVINKIQLIESVEGKAKSIFDKYAAGSKDQVNSWSLAETHAKNQSI
jgi:hypothetical protein